MEESAEARAATSMVQYLAVMSVALEVAAQVKEARERQRAEKSEREAATQHAELRTRYARDRLGWEPLLDPTRREAVTQEEAAKAWCSAQGWHGYPDADTVAKLAEQKARSYAPDLMRLYDQLRDAGVAPVVAMGQAVAGARAQRTAPTDARQRERGGPWSGDPAPQRVPLEARDDAPSEMTPGAKRTTELVAEHFERPLVDLTISEAATAGASLTAEGSTKGIAAELATGRGRA